MTYGDWILEATEAIEKIGSKTPRLDALLLLSWASGYEKANLLTMTRDKLSVMRQGKLKPLLARRLNGEPMAYIAGQKEFYGRDFMVNKFVLIPRPESEDFIVLLKALRQSERVHNLLDMGTGSGNLAITVKLEHPDMYIFASDTSEDALKIAAQNSLRHKAAVTFKNQNLLQADKEGYDVIMANLPYVPTGPDPDPSIAHEPVEALFSGFDGLEHYRRFFAQLEPKHIRFIMTESLLSQHKIMNELAKNTGYSLTKTEGLIQLFVKNNA